jgi:phage portal protein BeeE
MIEFLRRSFGAMEQPDPGGWRARQAGALEQSRYREQTRAIDSFTSKPGLTEQLLAVQGLSNRPWRVASIKEAMGVPSNFRSVALIANTTGSLAMEAYRKGVLLDAEDTPRIIQRPDPFRIPRDFYRDTAFDQATRGEYWWWIASRDIDDSPLSVIRIAPWEIKIEYTGDRLRPDIFWGNRKMPLRDLRHGTFLPDPNDMTGPWQRGVGPLQLCGAAISVQVESDMWAANFFADGGYPSIWIKAAGELGELEEPNDDGETEEAKILLRQFREREHNSPFISDDGIEDVKEFGQNAQGSQMLDAREQNKGTSANLFGVPGALLEYGRPGSSLTYQTVTEVFTTFVRATLAPDYLESIEQNMSDLLTRSTVARFNVKGFLRADVKTRWEVYELATKVIGVEEAATLARQSEGLEPGDIEYAPVPFAPPQAIPSEIPVTRSAEPVRCDGSVVIKGRVKPCRKLLAEEGPFIGRCSRCGKAYATVVA